LKLSNIVQNLDVKVPPNFNLDIEITKLNTLQDGKEGELSFLYNDNYLSQIQNSKVSAIIIKKEYLSKLKKETIPLIAENPYIELAKATKFFNLPFENKNRGKTIINQSSYIDTSSHIGNNVIIDEHVQIFANCYIGDNVKIGKNSIIYPNVIIYKDTIIGKDVIIHSGTVVGSDGFGFATNNKGEHIKIYQNGYVEIEDKVEIGANSTIDRAVF
jgi:UDP-3-O-[3-hydroxymyristoyl] glucosamine N-acyltransferase